MTGRARPARLALSLSVSISLLAPGAAVAADFERTPTITSLAMQPATSTAGNAAKAVATVDPIPAGGKVVFTVWSAQSGGEMLETETISVNTTTGKAAWGGLTFPVGIVWFEASFKGTSYHAPSTSSRAKHTVVGKAPTVTHVANGEALRGGQMTVSWSISPAEAVKGVLEVLIGDDAYASYGLLSGSGGNTSGQIALPITLEQGTYELRLRHVPRDWKYGPGLSPATSLRVRGPDGEGDFLPFSVRSTDLFITAPASWDGFAVTHVRLANSSTMAGELLSEGTTQPRADYVAWEILGGSDGWRTVWMQLKLSDGSWTTPQSDQVYLDRAAPAGSFLINGGAATLGSAWGGSLYEQELTGNVGDASLAHGGAITHVAISNNGAHWKIIPFKQDPGGFRYEWMVIDEAWGGTSKPGGPRIRTVYMKWRDRAGNWSDVATQQIDLHWSARPVDMLVNGTRGAASEDGAYTSNPSVTLTFPVYIEPDGGIDYVVIHNLGSAKTKKVAWQPNLSVQWSLVDPAYDYTAKDGIKRIYAEVYPKNGHLREVGVAIFLDRATPTSTVPRPAFALNTTVSDPASAAGFSATSTSPAVAAEVSWTASDGNLVKRHDLQGRVNTAAWANVSLVDSAVPQAVQVLDVGPTFRYRTRSIDGAGTMGAWKEGPAFTVQVWQESAAKLTYGGTWKSVARSDALGGRLRTATAKGASVSMKFKGRAVSWVAPRSSAGDAADVYVDGKFVKTVYLSNVGYKPRMVVFSRSWKKVGKHTIRIVKKFANASEIGVDAILVLR